MALFGLIPDNGFVDGSLQPRGLPFPPGVTPTFPQQATVPTAPSPSGGGILSWLGSSMGGQGGGDAASMGLNRLGYLGAALQDAGDGGRGQRVAQFYERAQQAQAQQKLEAVNKAIRDAYSTGDMNKVRQALVEAASNGADISHITQALQVGQPKYEQVDPTRDTVSIDPITGQRTVVSKGVQPKPKPLTREYQNGSTKVTEQSLDGGQTWQPLGRGPAWKPDWPATAAAPPSGYRFAPGGNLEYIPGGPADPTKGAGKKAPTEDQAKNKQLYELSTKMLPQVLANYDELGSTLNQMGKASSGIPLIGPSDALVTSSGYQQADTGIDSIVANFLYSTSGATATPDEVKKRAATVKPKFGDSAETKALKKQALIDMVQSIHTRATPGTPRWTPPPSGGPRPPPAPTLPRTAQGPKVRVFNPKTGKLE